MAEAQPAAGGISEELTQIQTLFKTMQSAMKRFQKPQVEEFERMAQMLRDATACNRMGSDEEFAKFVNEELAIGLMSKLASSTGVDDVYLNAVADLMAAFVDLYALELKSKRYNETLTCAMTWCFKADTTLHGNHFQMSEDELKSMATQRQTWRKDLKVGDRVDVNVDGDNKFKTKGWVQGEIERISGDILSIVIPELPPSFDLDIDRWSINLAQFEARTKEDYEWRATWAQTTTKNYIVDMHDSYKWEEGTIFEVSERMVDGRRILAGNCGFRVYRSVGKKIRTDEHGVYDGWSSKYDEWIPLYSPRIQAHLARVNGFDEDEEYDEDLDDLVQPMAGHSRVYCVPRLGSCLSSKFLQMMNNFGNNGGFAAILDTFANEKADAEVLTLTMMMYMVRMISMPIKLFHKDWINEFGVPIAKAIMNQLMTAPDKVLRAVSYDNISQLQISINGINNRVMEKDQAKKAQQHMRLEMCKRFMTSELLDRRILGIKELNTIIRNTTMNNSSLVFSLEELIGWCKEHGVFDILWDPRKTHQQLVQRSNEIFKILPKENLLSPELLQQFWSLTKSDYKSEVFKIINETAFYLNQEHIEFLFDRITETPASKLGMEEFEAIASLGSYSKSSDFSQKSSDFFWRIITGSDEYPTELVETVVSKFSDMIKYKSMERKQPYFDNLVGQLASNEGSAIPVIRLFKKIIKDQKARSAYGTSTYSSTTYGGSTTVVNHGATKTADGKTVYSKSYNNESIYPNSAGQGQDGDIADEEDKSNGVTLRSVLNALQNEKGFVDALLNNLRAYCQAVEAKVAAAGDAGAMRESDRTKLFLVSAKYSHQDELNERLSFLQEFAVNSDFKISKVQLKVIYDLLTKSPIKSDFTEFLTWCSTACKAQVALDLQLVGEFFSELISTKMLDLAALPIVGFEFLKMHFTSINIEEGKLSKVQVPQKQKNSWSGGYYGTSFKNDDDDEEELKDDDASVLIRVLPSELINLDIMWTIALEAQEPTVVNKAVCFLVNCYLSVSGGLEQQRTSVMQSLNTRCFELIAASQAEPRKIQRLVRILETVIQISEKKGTGGVQPHNAILKGEMLDRIIVRFMVKNKMGYYSSYKLERSIIIKLYTSATVWELKKEVSQMLGLSPKYIKIKLPSNQAIQDNQHGMTLAELNLRNGDILTATKLSIVENVVEAELVDRVNRCLLPRAAEIFTEWYHLYKNQQTGLMDHVAVAKFVAGATKAGCSPEDERVDKIIKQYDTDNDSNIDIDGFLKFYYDAASGPGINNVRKNIKAHNVRADLKRMSEIYEEVTFQETEMPRHTLSANQAQFQALFNQLDRNDEASEDVWNLVRMLATNQQMYQEVLSLNKASADNSIDWTKVFEDQSLYRQIYKQEIIMAVMEASSVEDEGKRVIFVEELAKAATYSATAGTAQAGDDFEEEKDALQDSTADTAVTDKLSAENLKANWTKQFLEQAGWDYILQSFLGKEVSSNAVVTFGEQAGLKDLAFLMTLIRVFLQAGFNAQGGEIGQAINMVRRSSSIIEDSESSKKKSAGSDQFEQLMNTPDGQEIMLNTDYEQLLDKVILLLVTVLSKSTLIYEDKLIVENAMSIMVGILLFKQELYQKFQNYTSAGAIKSAQDLVLTGLLSQEEKVRTDFKSSLGVLAVGIKADGSSSLNFLMGVLAKNFAFISNKPSRQFFELFNKLIDLKAKVDALQGESAQAVYDPEELLNQTIDKIKQQKKDKESQKFDDQGDETKAMELAAEQERLLVGLITLTGKIIAKADKAVSDRIIQEKDLIGQIFKEFLFASYFEAKSENAYSDAIVIQQQAGSRKESKKTASSNNKSRQAAYELLHQLIKNSGTLMKKFLAEHLVPLISTIKKPKTWNYQPVTSSEGMQKYVGLRNLGCICYMNSMMQQFFMTPAFRYNLLCVDDGQGLNLQEYKGERIDDNMMHQLQKLIAHLELSERSEYNPKEFCFAFKEFDGSPTNTAEQKDAQEFLNLLFDRLENALKPTSRKHLVNGVFGGKMCSQMVCSECGKMKNRMEDYLNLSLPVKGVKSIEESLQKQVEGEIISDYQCDGCNRKVDLQKRTMIASTPNVLIVHLQRICFNFDTFQNDKVNSFCSFPNVLDLKPYSFHEVMGKEGRLKSQQEEEVIGNVQNQNEAELTEEEITRRREAEEEAREPELDDCYEYKLVGVNVHSGTANAGHYWSYINTNRGTDEKEGDNAWIKTEADPWMEFNDSRVSDWDFKELKQRTFGNVKGESNTGYFSAMGDSYGTSAYMLFYERRSKKDLKILVDDEKVEEAKTKGIDVQFDEEKKEHYKMSPYRSAADGELANDIYKKVAEDNMKFTFESDIFSTEFFDFIMRILQSVGEGEVDEDAKLLGLRIGTKVGFEILARMFVNPGIDKLSQVMVEILGSRPELSRGFLDKLCSFPDSEVLWEVLFECSDKPTQRDLAKVIKFALCQLKVVEKDIALSGQSETITTTQTDEEGKEQTSEEKRPKAVSLRFMTHMVEQLAERAPKHWRKFDAFLDIFFSFMVHSSEDIAEGLSEYDAESEAYKIGVELYFQNNMIKYLGDFVLQENSPYHEPDRELVSMAASYGTPNFSALLKTIIVMVSDKPMVAKYPLDEKNQAVVSHRDILQKMIEPNDGDFSAALTEMAKDNVKVSKKMAKTYLKAVSKTSTDQLNQTLNNIANFLKIEDGLKQSRLEWIFGIPQIQAKPDFRTQRHRYGVELLQMVSDEYCQFKSGCVKGIQDGFLGALFKDKGRMDTQCCIGLRALLGIMSEDEEVARFVFNQPSPSIQFARYTDWFFPYAEALLEQTNATLQNTTMLEYHKQRKDALEKILAMKKPLQAKFDQWIADQMAELEKAGEATFVGFADHTLLKDDSSVIASYPPTYLVGPIASEVEPKVLLTKDTELATITIEEVTCEYMYSNPQGLFNLSLPDKMWRDPKTYRQLGYTSWKIATMSDEERADGAADRICVKEWETSKLEAPVVLRVMFKSKATKMCRVGITLSVADNASKNVSFPLSEIKENLFSNDSKQAFIFVKTDPSKDGWGDISIDVNVKPNKTTQIYSSSSYGQGGYGGSSSYGYGNTGGYGGGSSNYYSTSYGYEQND